MRIKTLTYKTKTLLKNDLFWVLIISFTIRNLYHLVNPGMPQNADSVTYHYAAQNIFKGAIDASRTPIYPMLMRMSELITPAHPFKFLVAFQHLVSFLSIIPFYLFVKRVVKSRAIVNVLTVLYACFPPLLFYNYALFPEAIFIASLVFNLYLFSGFVQTPTAGKAIALNMFLFFMVMVKPVSLVFYGVVAFVWVLWFWTSRDAKHLKPVAISFLASVLLLAGYSGLNNIQNGYAGLTTISHDNTFINVIYSRAYRELPDKDFITAIDTTNHKGKYYTVFYLNNDHEKYQNSFASYPLEYMHQNDMRGVSTIPPNELGYTAENIRPYLRTAARTTTYARYILKKVFDFASFSFLFITGLTVYILILLDMVFILRNTIKLKAIDYPRALNLLMLLGLILAFFMGGVNDGTRNRVLLPIIPFLMVQVALLATDVKDIFKTVITSFSRLKLYSLPSNDPKNDKMIHKLIKKIHSKYIFIRRVQVIAREIAASVPGKCRILDIGCGDGRISSEVTLLRTDITYASIDILERPECFIPFEKYDGCNIPESYNSYDAVQFIDVLHHVDNIEEMLYNSLMPGIKYVIIKDHEYETHFDFILLKLMDWVGNAPHGVRLNYNYKTKKYWQGLFQKLNLKAVYYNNSPKLYPAPLQWIFGRRLHFMVVLINCNNIIASVEHNCKAFPQDKKEKVTQRCNENSLGKPEPGNTPCFP